MSLGKIIVIEGLDGSGKFTQSRILFNKLVSQGVNSEMISMPNYDSESSGPVKMYLNCEISENLWDINPFASSSFFAVDRFINYFCLWKKLYENGYTIICDRYSTSNMIYQLAKLEYKRWDEFLDWIYEYEYVKLGIPKPDVVVYLRVPVEISQNLMKSRGNSLDLHESNLRFLENCYKAANYSSKKFGWKTVDCSRDGKNIDSVESISEKIFDIVKNT